MSLPEKKLDGRKNFSPADALHSRLKFLSLFQELLSLLLENSPFQHHLRLVELARGLQKCLLVIGRTSDLLATERLEACFSAKFLQTILLQNTVRSPRKRPNFGVIVQGWSAVFGKLESLAELFSSPEHSLTLSQAYTALEEYAAGAQNFFLRSAAMNTLIAAQQKQTFTFYANLLKNDARASLPAALRDRPFHTSELYGQLEVEAAQVIYDGLMRLLFSADKQRNFIANCFQELSQYMKFAGFVNGRLFGDKVHCFKSAAYFLAFKLLVKMLECGVQNELHANDEFVPLLYLLESSHKMLSWNALQQLNQLIPGFEIAVENNVLESLKVEFNAHVLGLFEQWLSHRLQFLALRATSSFVCNQVARAMAAGSESLVLTPGQRLVIDQRWRQFADPALPFSLTAARVEQLLNAQLEVGAEQLEEQLKEARRETVELAQRAKQLPLPDPQLRDRLASAARAALDLHFSLCKRVASPPTPLALRLSDGYVRLA